MTDLGRRVARLLELVRRHGSAAVVLPEHVYYLTGVEPLRDYPALITIKEGQARAWWPGEVPEEAPKWLSSDVYAPWPVTDSQRRHNWAAAWSEIPGGAAIDSDPASRSLFRELVRSKEPQEVAVIERNVRDNDEAFRTFRAGSGKAAPISTCSAGRWKRSGELRARRFRGTAT